MQHDKPFKIRSEVVTAFARGQSCTLRFPGQCRHTAFSRNAGSDPRHQTTVACHMPGRGKGTGTKVNDIHIAFACDVCHDIVDMRAGNFDRVIVYRTCLDGIAETQALLFAAGIIKVEGA